MSIEVFTDGKKEMTPAGSCGLKKGEVILAPGEAMGAMEMEVTFHVTATANDNAGVTTAGKDAMLGALALHVTQVGEGGERDEPHQGTTFIELRSFAKQTLGEDMDGYADTSYGLTKALVAGAGNKLLCTMPVTTGYLKAITESLKYAGVGPSQALTMEVLVKGSGEKLKAAYANGELTKVEISFGPRKHTVSGDQVGCIPKFRREEVAKKDTVIYFDGLHLAADHLEEALATTNLVRLTAKVDDAPIYKDMEPADVVRSFERRNPGATTLTADKATLTPVYRANVGDLITHATGELSIQQVDKVEDWDTRHVGIEATSERKTRAMLEAIVKTPNYQVGDEVHFINTAMLLGIPTYHNHLNFTGARGFKVGEDRQAKIYPGMRVKRGHKARVHIPEEWCRQWAGQWQKATQTGNSELRETIERNTASYIPAGTEDGRGFSGARTQVRNDVVKVFTRYLEMVAKQQADARRAAQAKK